MDEIFPQAKFLIIYVYYELQNHQKNQTNLSFFIRHGLDKKKWKNPNIDVLFVINGHKSEVIIPSEPNFYVLKEDNCTDWEGYYNGIKYMEIQKKNKIHNSYEYIFFLNCGVIGPLFDSNKESHWLYPYYKKIKDEQSIICGNVVHDLPINDLGGPGFRISCYNFLLKINEEIISILTQEKIINVCEKSVLKYPISFNTVLGPKTDKVDSILTGEYALSRIIINKGYKFSSLIYSQSDYQGKVFKTNNYQFIDRYGCYNGQNLPPKDVIFYKNLWRWKDTRASIPVEYNNCINLMNKYCNMKNLDSHNDINYEINYDIIDCVESGVTTVTENSSNKTKYNWNSKKEFYNIHGYAEEILVFPKIKLNNDSVAIYHHYDSDNIIKDYVFQGIKSLIICGYDIYFYTSCSEITNVKQKNIPFKINYMPNYGAGTDFICYYECIKENLNLFKEKYKYLFFTNDSVIFPINGINNFKNVIKTRRLNSDFWGHWDSIQIRYHLIGTLIEFNILRVIDTFLNFLELTIGNYKTVSRDFIYFVNEVETKLTDFLNKKGMKSSANIAYNNYNYIDKSPFNPSNLYRWIQSPNTFAIKWKYMCNYINLNHINNPHLNYLLRYIHFGPNGVIGNYQKSTRADPIQIIKSYPDIIEENNY